MTPSFLNLSSDFTRWDKTTSLNKDIYKIERFFLITPNPHPLLSFPCWCPPPTPHPPAPPPVPPVAPWPWLQPGVRQHVYQDLVGPHPLHQEGREEGEEEGRGEEGGGEGWGSCRSQESGAQMVAGGGRAALHVWRRLIKKSSVLKLCRLLRNISS